VYLPAIGHPATAKEEADNPLNVHENAGRPVRVTDTIFPAVVHVPSVMLPLSASTMPIDSSAHCLQRCCRQFSTLCVVLYRELIGRVLP
jgi:hypothetical protein